MHCDGQFCMGKYFLHFSQEMLKTSLDGKTVYFGPFYVPLYGVHLE